MPPGPAYLGKNLKYYEFTRRKQVAINRISSHNCLFTPLMAENKNLFSAISRIFACN